MALLHVAVLSLLLQAAVLSAVDIPSVPLTNGATPGLKIPAVGIGTASYGPPGETFDDDVAEKAVAQWLQLGGRRIDESYNYGNQVGVGKAIKASNVSRAELFIVSKVGPGDPMGYNDTLAQMQPILDTLQVEYVDLLLIHWPGPASGSNDPQCQGNPVNMTACRQSTWKAMAELLKSGKTRSIGVSNYEQKHLEDIVALNKADSSIPLPAVNQVEFHPYWHEDELVKYCKSLKILFNSYSPLGCPDWAPSTHNWDRSLLDEPAVKSIAKAHDRTGAQVVLRWAWQQDIVVNPRTERADHMKENLNFFDFELSDDEMKQLASIKPPDRAKVCPDPNNIN